MLLAIFSYLRGPAAAQDAFADAVSAFTPGINGGFGADELPAVVLGPPRGAGMTQGSLDVVALGSGGSIVLRFDLPVICDGPGADFTVFENAFHSGSPRGPLFTEYGFVAVSQDGSSFVELPYNAETRAGLAGQHPVLSNPENEIDPLDPSVSGGDQFDLASVGLAWVAYVRISDVAGAFPDVGDMPQFSVSPNAGFDLDAVAALHACEPGLSSSATPTASPTPTRMPATATATRTAGPPRPGDLNDDGHVTSADADALIREIFDGDGDSTGAASGGAVNSDERADVNQDDFITAADLTALATVADAGE